MNKTVLIFLLLLANDALAQSSLETITVFFDSNEFTLQSEQKVNIISFFSAENTIIESITVEGFCDDIGSNEANIELSKKRAISVENFIKKEFNAIATNVEGKGEIALSNTTSMNKNERKIGKLLYK
jgi:outer membrane protein OmpA-like peptidoglycan-associated protein